MTKPLVSQPTAAPTRKLKYGIVFGILVSAGVAALNVYNPSLANTLTPVIYALAGSLGVAVPAYVVKNERL